MLLRSLHERNNGNDQRTYTKKDQEVSKNVESKYNSSNDTQKSENQIKIVGKRKSTIWERNPYNINEQLQHKSNKLVNFGTKWTIGIAK